jgi:hypothetical protein
MYVAGAYLLTLCDLPSAANTDAKVSIAKAAHVRVTFLIGNDFRNTSLSMVIIMTYSVYKRNIKSP